VVHACSGTQVHRFSVSQMPRKRKKNPHAVALSKLGARKGGIVRSARMTAEERSESARTAAKARWDKKK
jgi:hypothetical protein